MKLHIKIKRYLNNPYVYCGRSIGSFSKVEPHEVKRLLKFHETDEYFCATCLKYWRKKQLTEIK